MKAAELAENGYAYLKVGTCYLKGFWGQQLTQAEYNRVLAMYPDNKKYGNAKYIGTDIYPFDCICFIKNLLAGGKVGSRLSYAQMASNPLGDCNNQTFYNKLYDCVSPMEGKAGYGLATTGHAALCLGEGRWLDVNFSGSQNGLALHNGFSGTDFKCGKIPGIDYAASPVPDEKEIITKFLNSVRDAYLAGKF